MTSARFWDRMAERYARTPINNEAAYRKKLQVTRRYLKPDMRVLELGCGTGATSIEHAPFVEQIRAVDISPKMIEIASRKAQEAGVSNVAFEASTIETLDVPDASVDVVLMLSILHLLDDRDVELARAFRMLRPGGVLVSNTACLGDSMRWLGLILPVAGRLGLLPMVRIFSAGELEASISGAGFSIEHRWRPAPADALFIIARRPD